jgi:DNA-binding MarR family transcriptional regulator
MTSGHTPAGDDALLDVALALLPARGSEGLTPLQLKALAAIERAPASGVIGLASTLEVDKAAASRVMASLHQRALVSRKKGTSDRRRFELRLTAKGSAELHAIRAASSRLAGEIVETLPEGDREKARDGLVLLARALQASRRLQGIVVRRI